MSEKAGKAKTKKKNSQVKEKSGESEVLPVKSEMRDLQPSSSQVPGGLDPLRQYLSEISQYPLLDPEEEKELAQKLKETGDINAAKILVQANLRLVVKIAMEYRNAYQNIMDLIQEGNVGLMKAVSKYDPGKGAKLSYYASWWIRSYILKYILENFRLVKIGTTQAQKKLFFNLMKEKQRLENQGQEPVPRLIAENLGVKEKEVLDMEKRLASSGSDLSLDTPLNGEDGDSGQTIMGAFADEDQDPVDEILASEELKAILVDQLKTFSEKLSPREQHILKDRLMAELPKTLQEIADRYGISRERARQIESKILEKLKAYLKDYIQ